MSKRNFEITKSTAYKEHLIQQGLLKMRWCIYTIDDLPIPRRLLFKFFDSIKEVDLLKQRSIKYVKR